TRQVDLAAAIERHKDVVLVVAVPALALGHAMDIEVEMRPAGRTVASGGDSAGHRGPEQARGEQGREEPSPDRVYLPGAGCRPDLRGPEDRPVLRCPADTRPRWCRRATS